ncbi:ABC-2 family transporter protein [Gottschalkia purinilytica]|uniref:ABC-2 family transporter protein n=1 Tax=Gottschalkia purinilytica TaxID=1503 RepID=A0A0L0W9S4_GOTPU|nr:ABC transporter permease [Gottschalkia purinilytica]KNF08202.1 ABC-2 family transporter protein [Gottschalkia purinilytica]
MAFMECINSEILKHKRTLFKKLLFLFPIGEAFLVFLDIYIRKDYLIEVYSQRGLGKWDMIFLENYGTAGYAIFFTMFSIIIASIVFSIEDKNGGWKYSLTIPLSKEKLYISKYITSIIATFTVPVLNTLGLIIIGLIFGFEKEFDIVIPLKNIVFQWIALFGIISTQQFLSVINKNNIKSVSYGVLGTFLGVSIVKNSGLGYFIPYNYLFLAYYTDIEIKKLVLGSLISTAIFLTLGVVTFKRKDITN